MGFFSVLENLPSIKNMNFDYSEMLAVCIAWSETVECLCVPQSTLDPCEEASLQGLKMFLYTYVLRDTFVLRTKTRTKCPKTC